MADYHNNSFSGLYLPWLRMTWDAYVEAMLDVLRHESVEALSLWRSALATGADGYPHTEAMREAIRRFETEKSMT